MDKIKSYYNKHFAKETYCKTMAELHKRSVLAMRMGGTKIPPFVATTYSDEFVQKLKIETDTLIHLDSGSFGSVYSGLDTNKNKRYAIKVLTAQIQQTAVLSYFLKLSKNEIHFLQTLKHPNIVKYYDNIKLSQYKVTSLPCYIVIKTEYLEETLHTVIMSGFQANSNKTFECLLNQIGSALAFMHSSKVAHHDIKTNNIMIKHIGKAKDLEYNDYEGWNSMGEQFQYKLIDFGLAKKYSSKKDRDTRACGTLQYMPKEKHSPANYNPFLTDAYSFGVVLLIARMGHAAYDVNREPFENAAYLAYKSRDYIDLIKGLIADEHGRWAIRDEVATYISASCK